MHRIVIVGSSSTGKTTLAKNISKKLNIKHQELDEFFWEANWKEADPDVFINRVEQLTQTNEWVIDGNYSKIRDLVWSRATDVIWLDYPIKLILSQFFKRSFVRAFKREELWNSNKESLWNNLLKSDSLLMWILKTRKVYKQRYNDIINSNIYPQVKYHHMKSHSDSNELLQKIDSHQL